MKRSELAAHSNELGFTPRDAVRWLAPAQLGRTAVRVVLASVFADFGDKRELEGGFPARQLDLDELPVQGQPAQPVVRDRELPRPGSGRSPRDAGANPRGDADRETWLDFTADLGDGFDATYTVASLLGLDSVTVDGQVLPRGKALVLGGDEVYPVASAAAYEDRMVGPFRKAFPAGPAGRGAVLLALPGNHDWYDGLTSFIRLFTRQRNIGGWRTIQTRSYFSVRLTGGDDHPGWWLVGLDSQLGQYIDEPQLDYFYDTVTTRLQPGDAIILCVASPYWVHTAENRNAFKQMNFFEQNYLRHRFNRASGTFEETGASVRLWLTGDLHHYSRYEERGDGDPPAPPNPRRTQLITCGLGGAFLADAQWLPGVLTLPLAPPPAPAGRPAGEDVTPDGGRRFERMPGTFPGPAESRQLRGRLANPFSPFWLPVRNPGFGTAIGVVHLGLVLTLWTVFCAFRGLSFVDSLFSLRSGNTALLSLVIVAVPALLLALVALLRSQHNPFTAARGILWQLAALTAGIAVVLLLPWPAGWPPLLTVLLVLALAFAVGFVAGSEAFAFYVMRTRTGEVAAWKMSGQAIEDHKGFLRLRIAPDGTLTVFPVAVDRVCRDWDLERTDDGGVRPVPAGGLPQLRLFEAPVTISREGFPP